jgi:hypothetical protein
MSFKDAVKILMESPLYFLISLTDRKELIKEFCQLHKDKKNLFSE